MFDQIQLEVPDLDVPYVADFFHVSDSTVRRWVASGDIDHCRIGGLVRFTARNIQDFIRRAQVKASS